MNTIQINPDGSVTLSSETVAERREMASFYASQERDAVGNTIDGSPSQAGGESEAYDAGFKGGWAAAVQETQLRFINGQLLDFYNEQGTPSYTMDGVSQVDLEQAAKEHEGIYGAQDPHYQEPLGTGESDELTMEGEPAWESDPDYEANWGKAHEAFLDERPRTENILFPKSASTQDPHDPEHDTKEDPEYVEPGTWTLSNEELNSRINEAYRRGNEEGYQTGFANGQTIQEREVTRRTLMGKAMDVVSQDTIGTFARGEGTPTRFHDAFGPSVENFVVPLVRSLGFKVVD
jgi:hypothetical protein